MPLVAGFLPWRSRFEPKSDHGICGGHIRQVLSEYFGFRYQLLFRPPLQIRLSSYHQRYTVLILTTPLNNQLKRTKYPSFATVFRNMKQPGYNAVSRHSRFFKLNTKLCQQQNGYYTSSFSNKNNKGGETYLSSVFVRLLVSIC
jgi:hypothetical protein